MAEENMAEDRSWMYSRLLDNQEVNLDFIYGVLNFLDVAFSNPSVASERNNTICIPCPCIRCKNFCWFNRNIVEKHLLDWGFLPRYERWLNHGEGEADPNVAVGGHPDSNEILMEEMLMNAAGPDFNWERRDGDEPPNEAARDFFDMLDASKSPLWEVEFTGESTIKCDRHSVLSAVTQLLAAKADFGFSAKCYDRIISIVKSMLPPKNGLPESFYCTKRMVKGLGMKYIKYDVCPNNCMLYYKPEDKTKEECDICGEPRYKQSAGKKKIPQKVLRYLPITPRLQRLYMTRATAKQMRWHKEGVRKESGKMYHPADAEAWKTFDQTYPEFASEPRNVRLGLATDGFAPFSLSAAQYTCWPVVCYPLNLPPNSAMKRENMFLTLVIPGPHHPGRDIDVFLQPLIDELEILWSTGIETYDVSLKQNFNMKVALSFTVNDFPAYSVLSGWSTYGSLACPCCMDKTRAFTLHYGNKLSWFDTHRKFLPEDHPYRANKKSFLKGRREEEPAPPILTGKDVRKIVDQLPEVTFGKTMSLNQIPGYLQDHNWQKRSIFWRLTYWEDNLVRHYIDIMHLENNFGGNVVYTVFDVSTRTKDTANSRKDMKVLCNRPELNLVDGDKKPRAVFALDRSQKREILKWLKEKVKFPDGYASNLSRCVNLTTCTFNGLKTHDMHVLVERILPVALRDYLSVPTWEAIAELSNFFREICAKELDPLRLIQLEKEVVVTLCKLEMIFPPSFFDRMEHLALHLPYEARVGGPVNFRWMYPVERRIKEARKRVTNKARVEGSIAESYLTQEISDYCKCYFAYDSGPGLANGENDNVDCRKEDQLSVFNYPGRALSPGQRETLELKDFEKAHLYVLYNCPEIKPFLEEYEQYIKTTRQPANNRLLQAIVDKEFPDWLRKTVLARRECNQYIKSISLGPVSRDYQSYGAYEINGFVFHTKAYGETKSTVNSGVCITGESDDGGGHDYYGILEDIVELEYPGVNNKVVLFKCHWFDVTNGVKIDKKNGLVEVKHKSKLWPEEPFGLAAQALQVYYLPYPNKDRRDWWVVYKCNRKPFHDENNNPIEDDFYQEESTTEFEVSLGEGLDLPGALVQLGILDPVDINESEAMENDECEDNIPATNSEDEEDEW